MTGRIVGRIVGRVAAVRRFPVKSMAGEVLDAAEFGWTGMAGDRQFAFVRSADTSHFPWCTGRLLPDMLLHRASYAGDGRVAVTLPSGVAHDVADPALLGALADAAGQALHLLRLARGCYDAQPVSVLTTGLLATIGTAAGTMPDPLRFRANLLVETAEGVDERAWAGADLAIGEVRLRGTCGIPRCAMIALDPATAARDPSLLRTVAQHFGGMAGLYAGVAVPGAIRVGDPVRLL